VEEKVTLKKVTQPQKARWREFILSILRSKFGFQ
jgi:hypothetical protein